MGGSPRTGDGHPPIPPETPTYDVFVSLAMVAAVTSRIRVGTNVYNIGLRHPFIVARAVASLDVLSNGRLDFGIGASWLAEEWEAVEIDFENRGRRIDETIDVCRRLWSEDAVEHQGRVLRLPSGGLQPQTRPAAPSAPSSWAATHPAAPASGGDGRRLLVPLNYPLESTPATLRAIEASSAGQRANQAPPP